jgi:hypothetical protein
VVLASPAIVIVVSSTTIAFVLLARGGPYAIRRAIAPAALLAIFCTLWWWLALRPHVDEQLKKYWEGYFIPHDRGLAHAVFIAARGVKDLFVGAVPLPTSALAALAVPAAVVVLFVFRRFLPVLLLVVGPVALALVLAALRAAPLGTGRTDVYLYPGLAMAVGLAVDELGKRSFRTTAAGVATAIVLTAVFFQPALAYPMRVSRPLLEQLNARARPSDTILVRASDDFALALYGRWPITFLRTHDIETGFVPRVDRDHVAAPGLVTHELPGLDARPWAKAIAEAAASSPRVWLLGESAGALGRPNPRLEPVRKLLRQNGFVLVLEQHRPGADLTLWAHRPT